MKRTSLITNGVEDEVRQVVLHYHFFKNAGTTIESVLKQSFGGGLAHFDSDDPNGVISNPVLVRFLEQHSNVVAITSHHLRPPKPVSDHFVFYDILFLRHPLARLWSTYQFYRRMDEGKDSLALAAQERSAGDFFQVLMDEYPFHASNAQVNLIANAGDKLPVQGDLERARSILLACSVPGTAELFDESAVLAECVLGSAFGQVDFSYVAQNVTKTRVLGLQEQLQEFESRSGSRVFARLLEMNQLDIALHETTSGEIRRRFALLSRGRKQLTKFRQRCARREQETASIIIASNHPTDFSSYANLACK